MVILALQLGTGRRGISMRRLFLFEGGLDAIVGACGLKCLYLMLVPIIDPATPVELYRGREVAALDHSPTGRVAMAEMLIQLFRRYEAA